MIYRRICSKRLQPFLSEAIKVLERCQEIELSKGTKELLLKISSASIDRCLGSVRRQSPPGLSTTKPGSLLKNLIPVDTFTAWNEERPGFMEIDLVAYCGNSVQGQFLNTLTCTDISTGWTDVTALSHRSQEVVSEAIHLMRQRLPLPLLGIDSDKTIKRYDPAKTPYQRALERQEVSFPAKARLMNLYLQLNPAELRRSIDLKTAKLWKLSR